MDKPKPICYVEFLRAGGKYASLYNWVKENKLADKTDVLLNERLGTNCSDITKVAENVAFLRLASPELRDLIFETAGHVPICSNGNYAQGAEHPGEQRVKMNSHWQRLAPSDEHLINWASNPPSAEYLARLTPREYMKRETDRDVNFLTHGYCLPCHEALIALVSKMKLDSSNPAQ